MNRRFILAGFASILITACTASTPAPVVINTPTVITQPTFTPTLIPAPTPVHVLLTVKDTRINCRFGPGITYELINELPQGELLRAVGRNESSTWWYVNDPGNPSGHCWVSADVTQVDGAADQLPVIQSPGAAVTDVSLRIEPSRIVVNCNQFPQTIFLEAQVTTNSPAYVTWRWEASTGVSSPDATLVFEQAGMQLINDYYQIGAPNDYWIKLHILTPNEWIEEVKFPVTCTQ